MKLGKKLRLGGVAALTVAAGIVAAPAPPAHAWSGDSSDYAFYFTMCPSTQSGVVGDHTSCEFADNVYAVWAANGAFTPSSFVVYSQVTRQRYIMNCTGRTPLTFLDGEHRMATRCWGGNDADVVVW